MLGTLIGWLILIGLLSLCFCACAWGCWASKSGLVDAVELYTAEMTSFVNNRLGRGPWRAQDKQQQEEMRMFKEFKKFQRGEVAYDPETFEKIRALNTSSKGHKVRRVPGSGSSKRGAVLVFLYSFHREGAEWRGAVKRLSGEGWDCMTILVDPFTFRTSRPDIELWRFIEQAVAGRRAAIVGQSIGGVMARFLAPHAPTNTLFVTLGTPNRGLTFVRLLRAPYAIVRFFLNACIVRCVKGVPRVPALPLSLASASNFDRYLGEWPQGRTAALTSSCVPSPFACCCSPCIMCNKDDWLLTVDDQRVEDDAGTTDHVGCAVHGMASEKRAAWAAISAAATQWYHEDGFAPSDAPQSSVPDLVGLGVKLADDFGAMGAHFDHILSKRHPIHVSHRGTAVRVPGKDEHEEDRLLACDRV